MSKKIQDIIQFIKVDIWRLKPTEVSPPYSFAVSALKKLLLAVRFFTTKGVFESAAALTYSTIPFQQLSSQLLEVSVFPNILKIGFAMHFPVSHKLPIQLSVS